MKKKKLNESRIAVIEGKWFGTEKLRRNASVSAMFDLLCMVTYGDEHSYHYEMFNNGEALDEIVQRLAGQNGIHYLYIAAHGGKRGIYGSNDKLIPSARIIEIIQKVNNERGVTHGLYFGSCLFATGNTLQELLSEAQPFWWMAGYEKTVDFTHSSALDLIFWNHYLDTEGSPLERIRETGTWLKKAIPGLIEELGFKLYCRDDRISDIIDLLAEQTTPQRSMPKSRQRKK